MVALVLKQMCNICVKSNTFNLTNSSLIFTCHTNNVWFCLSILYQETRARHANVMSLILIVSRELCGTCDSEAFLAFPLSCTGWKALAMFGGGWPPLSEIAQWSPQCLIGRVVRGGRPKEFSENCAYLSPGRGTQVGAIILLKLNRK